MESNLKVYGKSGDIKTITFSSPARLSDILAQNGIEVEMPCGGRQRCLKCKVRAKGSLSPMGDWERTLLTEHEIKEDIRYACMAEALGDVEITLLSTGYRDEILTEGYLPQFELNTWGKGFGIAVDIGTTTVAAYLYSLADGKLLSTHAEKNPQAVYGADVVSRLQKSMDGEAKGLASIIRDCLSRLITGLCKQSSVPLDGVDSMVITGNSAMLYLLCEMDPKSIAVAPFEMDCNFGFFLSSRDLNLPGNIKIYLPRCISAYVGADITTALMAAEFVTGGKVAPGKPRLLVDIGTNGEMALAADGMLFCCSTAAGPAFEGAGIHQGIPARTGAIYRVTLDNGRITSHVLGGGKAEGICGSGLLDAVAVMREARILDETGLICDSGHDFAGYITDENGQPAFLLPGTSVLLTQQDIQAVQLAKSAICAGIDTLIKESGYTREDISELVIAGGFGSRLDIKSAEKIGLIPPGFSKKAYAIGNAAGSGASMLLLSEILRIQSEQIAGLAKTVELSTHPYFMEKYIDGMYFPGV